MNDKTQFIKNLLAAFLAQGISLLASVFISFIIPKFLGVKEYGYWQLFIFYIGYVGFFHFGFNDGLYLRLGGKKFEELEYDIIGTQFKLFFLIEFFICIFVVFIASFVAVDSERKFVWIATGVYLLLNNLTLCLGYLFQAINETKIFSISSILDRVFVLASIFFLLWQRQNSFVPFVMGYTLSRFVSCVYCIWMARRIVFSKLVSIRIALAEMWLNVSTGIKLMAANIMSMLILGIGRVIIDRLWGIESFGKISFSLSLANFFLLFIQQVSMVLFPALRRTEESQQKKIYNKIRVYLGLFLPAVFIAYFPLKLFVGWWLPQYSESLKYLALLLPLCTFDGKMQMLCNTYLKVLRQEKKLLQFNVYAFVISLGLCSFSGYVLHSLTGIVISMVLAIMFRSIVSELFLAKEIGIQILGLMIQEVFMVLAFLGSIWFFHEAIAFGFTVLAYGIYLFLNRKSVKYSGEM